MEKKDLLATISSDLEPKKAKFIEVLMVNVGNVSKACSAFGIERKTFYNWKNNDPIFEKEVENIEESLIDFTESKLFEKISGTVHINETIDTETKFIDGEAVSFEKKRIQTIQTPPDTSAITFFLKTKGKLRGYSEKQEIDLNMNKVFENLTEEQIKAILNDLET